MDFSNKLIKWYLANKRDLPWRNTTDPYPIWISEIMLQQTRVAQGLPYFLSFINHFPTVFDLANAEEEQVLKLWQGLGYYSRARNLHQTAKSIAYDKNGIFPENYKDLLDLKGIGSYTAAAIASFAYNENVPVVDGNVFRVLARYFDVEDDIATPSAKKKFWDLARNLMPKESQSRADPNHTNTALFNQAMMEFGALQCTPKKPECENCVFNDSCAALQKKKVALLPIKNKKVSVKNRFLNYIIYKDIEDKTIVQQRTEKGIWQNLYEFPLIETKKTVELEYITSKIDSKPKITSILEINKEEIMHKLTHQKLHIKFWEASVNESLINGISQENLIKLPFPIVIYNFIEKHFKIK